MSERKTTPEPESGKPPEMEWREPGYDAERPAAIPPAGWKQVANRVWKSVGDDRLTLVAAALAFFALLGLFPALTALVAIYGLIFNPQDILAQTDRLSMLLPDEARSLVRDQLNSLVDSSGSDLGFGLVLSLVLLLWSASSGVQNLIRAVNLAYDEKETRSFVRLRLLALVFTLGGLIFFAVAIALIAIVPPILELAGLGTTGRLLVSVLRWPLLAAGVILALAVLYRLGPDRTDARWRWISWGAVVAATIWLAASALFALYVERFGSYNETYGALGAVVVLLLWFYLSAFAILIGAELNSELEHQTLRDSTIGPAQPMGERGAVVADTVPGDG